MNEIDRNIMTGMISILNQAITSKCHGAPIMNDEQFNIRVADLKDFEDETGVMFINSPNCKVDILSIINVKETEKDSLKECKDTSEIVEYSNQKEMAVYLDINGVDMIATYEDGCLTNIQIDNTSTENNVKYLDINLPYKINKGGVYTVKGKITLAEKPIFYVSNVINGASGSLKDDLQTAKELNFDVAPFWIADNLNANKLQSTIDYMFDYISDDDLDCNGVVFKFNEKECDNVLRFVGCYYSYDKC